RKMITMLSDFLRGTLVKDDSSQPLLKDELAHLQLYLEIEKVRFGHRLIINSIIDENTLEMSLPSLLLQPVLENAIKFGLYNITGEVVIKLESVLIEGILKIIVTNPFDAETSQSATGTGYGLNSISRRLYLISGRQDLLKTEVSGSDFITTILIPQKK
ncbi:MAG: histidine kinase, partial [Bacteroidia bacterium]|nr:histidine kinase [Bacteroidia bacterium]